MISRRIERVPNWTTGKERVSADWRKLWLLVGLVGSFFAGGVVGALGFQHVGFGFTLPLAALLLLLAAMLVLDDLRS